MTEQRFLNDPWERLAPIPLDGPLERHRHSRSKEAFYQVFQAFLVLLAAIILFQVISAVASVVILLAEGVGRDGLIGAMTRGIDEHAAALLTANTIGQVLGLALPAIALVSLHSSRRWAFLRFRRSDAVFIILALVALAGLLPVIQWLGNVNQSIPLPEFLREFERVQMELLEKVLAADTGVAFNLFVLAITPAFCEELLFRGYVQRQAERGLGARGGILFSGIFFGLYHLRLTQVLPLVVLGIFLAYLVWRTGSLWPAIAVHFANNAFAVFLGAYVSTRTDLDPAKLEQMEIPWYFVAGGIAFSFVVLYAMHKAASMDLAHRGAGDSAVGIDA